MYMNHDKGLSCIVSVRELKAAMLRAVLEAVKAPISTYRTLSTVRWQQASPTSLDRPHISSPLQVSHFELTLAYHGLIGQSSPTGVWLELKRVTAYHSYIAISAQIVTSVNLA
jgi:hypothetical protein